MKILDNITNTVRDDLRVEIKRGSKISVAAACFSMYAYQELKKQLESVEEFRFIFTSPTFVKEKVEKQKREFYIPRLSRETSLYGTEFEIKLRNEMTQRAIARECADWIRRKAKFKSNTTGENMTGFMTVDAKDAQTAYMPMSGFTTVDIGCERGNNTYNMVNCMEAPFAQQYMQLFEQLWNNREKIQDVTNVVIENISTVYAENPPEFIYFMTLYHVFSEFLDDISEDVLPNEATGFKQSKIWSMLYDFQRDAVLAIINKLENYNGCILADSVGLGKTFTALAVVKYYENRNKSVLVLCPKKLAENWNTYKDNYVNNPIAADRLNYDVLFHTDLSRNGGMSNGLDLSRLNWGNYDLIVIDESHNFRNGIGTHSNTQENRYQKLMEKVIRAGVKTKVLMLSATPVNNRFVDLKNQLAIAYEGNSENLDERLNTTKSLEDIFKQAQKAFNAWSKLEQEQRTTDALLRTLDFDFFELLDSVTIARSRKHIEKYYDTKEIGKFPERLKPISLRPNLTDLGNAINYNEIYEQLMQLSLCVYTPSNYIFPSKLQKYKDFTHNKGENLTQTGRERGIQRLMSINLLKRLESSVNSFQLTLTRIKELIGGTIEAINCFEKYGSADISMYEAGRDDWDIDDENTEFFTVGKKVKIELADMDWKSWRKELQQDAEVLELLTLMVADITPEHDTKLQELLRLLDEKIAHPINLNNKKVLIFSAFSDTAEYLYDHVSMYMKDKYGLNTAVITGTIDGRTTIKDFPATLNNVLTCFSPVSKDRDVLMPNSRNEIDILIATDCISEGQNLQDCDYLVNYDIHWNPVRIIQRFGRIDRIGSRNKVIQLVNFWPDLTLDDYINLKSRVETRMKITVMTSTGDDDLINPEEQGDLEYRKAQLKRLQEEVVDIEDMSDGISIMDLGLNEFRLDLLDYMKHNGDMDKKPRGLHAVVPATEELPEGVIFVLKNINNSVNVDNRNRIHPFYMVYIAADGEIICDYLNPKKLLDDVRLLCRGQSKPIAEVYKRFNRETDDGRNMADMSELLSEAIKSIIDVKEESDIDSLFSAGGTSALMSTVSGLDDFELICFLVVK
ncbi:DEAD/DEAH box helicase family protein [Anaerosacchariphilus sp. NSJ-68]|uniref:DEAD/DEAH box helicase family protein n=2 Tax=Lachnospiraceae TaxID=186803 RepID=A0A923LAT7_9FIRM|nr:MULTISPECIES: helicase-related protein [Lachnospiraceae]MBC5658873.1 DEAD/DEAH box helicase family protein [Anaerosacchariphilus hominis]MBC5698858.1 DEAD/DEAH box helicase family protein [Roseburia difficilis]